MESYSSLLEAFEALNERKRQDPQSLSEEEKSRRLQTVIAEQERIAAEINAGMVGQQVEVLVEGPARRRAGWLCGKTPHFKTTVFPACGAAVGDLVEVSISGSTAHTLIAG